MISKELENVCMMSKELKICVWCQKKYIYDIKRTKRGKVMKWIVSAHHIAYYINWYTMAFHILEPMHRIQYKIVSKQYYTADLVRDMLVKYTH